jgi:hypothetical protein
MFESRESSSPILTRAINTALNSEYVDSYQFTPIEKALLYGVQEILYTPGMKNTSG